MPDRSKLAEAALEAVNRASRVCRAVQRDLDGVREITKDDRSPVTVADFASQAVVVHALREALGSVRVVGEEGSAHLRDPKHAAHLEAALSAARIVWPDASVEEFLRAIDEGDAEPSSDGFWTLDPIDGTKGFIRGQQYAVSLGWIENGRAVVGALGCPNLAPKLNAGFDGADPRGVVFLAVGGEGVRWTTADEKPGALRTLDRFVTPPGSPIRACESVESGHTDQSASSRILDMAGGAGEPARLDSQCKYAVVARGEADAYLRLPTKKGYVERIWDHAAGAIVAQEAGCAVTDIHGRELDFSKGKGLEVNSGILCADREVHARLLRAIADLGITAP